MKRNTKKSFDQNGNVTSLVTYFGSEENGHYVCENFVNGNRVEYCEFIANQKSGLCKVFSEDGSVVLEESLWGADTLIESKKFHRNGRLKSHIKYVEGTVVLEKLYTESGFLLKSFENGRFPVLISRTFYDNSSNIETEIIRLNSEIVVNRSFSQSGQLKLEAIMHSEGRKAIQNLSVRYLENGHVAGLSVSHGATEDAAHLAIHLTIPIPFGEWIMFEPGRRQLMRGLKCIGELQDSHEPVLNLKDGWCREGVKEVLFSNGRETPYFRIYDKETAAIKTQFEKIDNELIFLTKDEFGCRRTCSRKIGSTEWNGVLDFHSRQGETRTEFVGYSRPSDGHSPPVEFIENGVSQYRDYDGETFSEETYHLGVRQGPAVCQFRQSGNMHRIEEYYKANQVVRRKVWINGQLVSELA